jgi:biopolymer transport protein ExbB
MKQKYMMTIWAVTLLLGVGVITLQAQQEPAAAAETAPAPKKLTLLGLVAQGGWAMYPLALCSFLLISMVVVNFRHVNQKRMMPPGIIGQIKSAARNRDIGTVWQLASSHDSLFTTSLRAGLRHIDPDDIKNSKPKMEEGIAEVVGRQESQAGFWINFLSLVAAISPMVGLLGTVSGMIGAFQKISAGGMGKPELLAGNIGEALITTATGLVIAIPALFFSFLFRNILNRILIRAEEDFSEILDHITGSGIAEIVSEPAYAPATPAMHAGQSPRPAAPREPQPPSLGGYPPQ